MRKKKQALQETVIYDLSDFFKILGDSTRLKILLCLEQGEKTVTKLCEDANMTKSAISHQLRVLKNSRIVRYTRNGKNVIYSLADEHVSGILKVAIEHIMEK